MMVRKCSSLEETVLEQESRRMNKCTATTASGRPCQAWAIRGSSPPLCAAHRGASPAGASVGGSDIPAQDEKRFTGAPMENGSAEKTGFYAVDPSAVSINQAIAGLVDKMTRLDRITAEVQANAADTKPGDLMPLFRLYTQASSHLSRLLRDRHALSGEADDEFAAAIGQALDELGAEWGVDL
jgi:hypothetical protein